MKTPFSSNKSFKVDHTYENDIFYNIQRDKDDDISTISGGSKPPPYADDPMLIFESPEDRKLRKRSHIVVYLTMFVMTIGFSIVISGVWPYLQQLDPDKTKTAMGWVIAANPFGQFIASPIVGYIGNKLGSIRRVCYGTMTIFILGSLMYSFLPLMDGLWPHSAYHLMIIARFLTGLSASNVTLCRSYVAASTTMKERTTGISIISAAQSLGFVFGPIIQAVLSLILQDDMQYRACGWVAALLGVINFFLLTPFVFTEYDIAEKERQLLKEKHAENGGEFALPTPDYLAMSAILFGFFINQFDYVLLESLLEPYVTDTFAWCDDLAVVIVGVVLALAGLLALPMFFTATRLAKRYDERKILMLGAFIPISIGLFLMLPWGPGTLNYCSGNLTSTTPISITSSAEPHLSLLDDPYLNPVLLHHDVYSQELTALDDTLTEDSESKFCEDSECLGCPPEQEWCDGYPAISMTQFFIGFYIVCGGYPYGVSMCNAIFSKMLGPKPQGTWMGVLTASGSLARITGPIFVSYTYTNLGSRWLFSILIVMMFCALVELSLLYKRLVPMKIPEVMPNNSNRK